MRARKRFLRSWLGEAKKRSGGAFSTTLPSSIIRIELATRSSWDTTTIVIAQRVTHTEVLRILFSIEPTEAMHFRTWGDKAGNAPPLTDPTNGLCGLC